MSRKLRIPAIFLSALAIGAWVGASLHFTEQTALSARAGSGCQSCCQPLTAQRILKKQIETAQMSPVQIPSECAACLAGALVQDAPVVCVIVALPAALPLDSAPRFVSAVRSIHPNVLPPERGPPA